MNAFKQQLNETIVKYWGTSHKYKKAVKAKTSQPEKYKLKRFGNKIVEVPLSSGEIKNAESTGREFQNIVNLKNDDILVKQPLTYPIEKGKLTKREVEELLYRTHIKKTTKSATGKEKITKKATISKQAERLIKREKEKTKSKKFSYLLNKLKLNLDNTGKGD